MKSKAPFARCLIVSLIFVCLAVSPCMAGCSGSSSKDASSSSSSTSISNGSSSGASSSSPAEPDKHESTSPTGVSASFKSAMDEYESFMNGYCEFMEKYMNSGYSASMLTDYSKWMSQYNETMAKINAIDTNSLSAADNAYYLEVIGRVNKKLASIL